MDDTIVRMPKLADTLVEGTVGQWLKQVGDQVEQGEPLASIETDKVTTEITSPATGTLQEILIAAGETVPVETPIARIAAPTAAEAIPAIPVASSGPVATGGPIAAGASARSPAPTPAAQRKVMEDRLASSSATAAAMPKPTPVAARLLAEHGLEARQITTRPGRLTKQDVLRHLQSSPAASACVPLTPMRRAIAEHMTRSVQTIPAGQTVMAADLTRLVAWRDQHKDAFQRDHGASLTFTVLFVHALARTLAQQQHSPVNLGHQQSPVNLADQHSSVSLGVAVAIDGGLIVPVLRAADTLSLGATAQAVSDLAKRARNKKLTLDETQGAHMTLSNVGTFGNLTALPIIPLNQVGILGAGLVERRPLPASDGGVRLGWRCLLSLIYDRRAVDDFQADRLLRAVVAELEQPPTSP